MLSRFQGLPSYVSGPNSIGRTFRNPRISEIRSADHVVRLVLSYRHASTKCPGTQLRIMAQTWLHPPLVTLKRMIVLGFCQAVATRNLRVSLYLEMTLHRRSQSYSAKMELSTGPSVRKHTNSQTSHGPRTAPLVSQHGTY